MIEDTTDIQHILVPVDGSQPSERAAQLAADMAKLFEAGVTILYVVPSTPAEMMGVRSMEQDEFDGMRQRLADEVMDAIVPIFRAAEVGAEKMKLTGDPAHEILTAIDAVEADLVILGTRGLNPAQKFKLGSVSDKVVRNAPCNVMVVR